MWRTSQFCDPRDRNGCSFRDLLHRAGPPLPAQRKLQTKRAQRVTPQRSGRFFMRRSNHPSTGTCGVPMQGVHMMISRRHCRAVNLAAFTPSCLVKQLSRCLRTCRQLRCRCSSERDPESLLNVSLIPLGCRGNVSRTATLVTVCKQSKRPIRSSRDAPVMPNTGAKKQRWRSWDRPSRGWFVP
jgi:hypothetical protein